MHDYVTTESEQQRERRELCKEKIMKENVILKLKLTVLEQLSWTSRPTAGFKKFKLKSMSVTTVAYNMQAAIN